jgi:hypothetical protein
MRRCLAGSAVGGINETQEILDFSAKHGICADIETTADGADTLPEIAMQMVLPVTSLCSRTLRRSLNVTNRMNSSQQIVPTTLLSANPHRC